MSQLAYMTKRGAGVVKMGSARDIGDVCCIDQAENQGRLHACCTHPEPAGLSPDLVTAYHAAAEAERKSQVPA